MKTAEELINLELIEHRKFVKSLDKQVNLWIKDIQKGSENILVGLEEDPEKRLKIMADTLNAILDNVDQINVTKKLISLKESILKEIEK
jgi:hypothetical protein